MYAIKYSANAQKDEINLRFLLQETSQKYSWVERQVAEKY